MNKLKGSVLSDVTEGGVGYNGNAGNNFIALAPAPSSLLHVLSLYLVMPILMALV